MTDAAVLVADQGAVRTITVNRPDKLNALNAEVRSLLKETFAELATDEEVRVVVMHGAGDKAFVVMVATSEYEIQGDAVASARLSGRRHAGNERVGVGA